MKKTGWLIIGGIVLLLSSAGEAMGLNLKPSVNIDVLTDQMQRVISVVQWVWRKYAPTITATITSANDGTHSANSKHYENQALDFRTHDLPAYIKPAMFDEVQSMLGSEYWVNFEDEGLANEHLHIQYNG